MTNETTQFFLSKLKALNELSTLIAAEKDKAKRTEMMEACYQELSAVANEYTLGACAFSADILSQTVKAILRTSSDCENDIICAGFNMLLSAYVGQMTRMLADKFGVEYGDEPTLN